MKIVLIPNDFLKGARLTRDLCHAGAKRKVIPKSFKLKITFSKFASRFKPKLDKTSAEPTFPLALRLPCFATLTPQLAETNATAVEILKVLAPSPPVPQVSTRNKSGLSTGNLHAFKRTSAIDANSKPVTPLDLKPESNAPVCTGII